MRTLRVAAFVEAASLLVLLVNLLTVHAEPITSLGGPTHGTAYLVVVAVTFTAVAGAPKGVRRRSLVPGIGGMLVLRRLGRAPEAPGVPDSVRDG